MSKSFSVTFIPNHAQHDDDPSDSKEWKTVYADSAQEAREQVEPYAQVLRVTEDDD